MARKSNQKKGLLYKLFGNHTREIKRDVRIRVKYYIKSNRRSLELIKRAYRESGTLKHSLLPGLQDKIILDLRTKSSYDSVTNQEIEKYIEAEVRKYFR